MKKLRYFSILEGVITVIIAFLEQLFFKVGTGWVWLCESWVWLCAGWYRFFLENNEQKKGFHQSNVKE
jgi:hypothetical protein